MKEKYLRIGIIFKKVTHKFLLVLFLGLIFHIGFAQSDFQLKGYLKGMAAMQSIADSNLSLENTLHNRFDFNWYATENLTLTLGLRNRVIAGNNITLIPNYSDYLSQDNGFFDLTLRWADQTSWVGISQFDRLFVDYTKGKFQITMGRQRINWGQSFVWNPNDLFNTYSYFDFDYEEKPGSDAVRIQYYLSGTSKLEWSSSLNKDSKLTTALLYRFNTKGYDIQILTGMYSQSDFIIGGGFSGSIAGGGFSGEFTFYRPFDTNENPQALTATLHYDYTFKSSLMLQFEGLYNGFGSDRIAGGLTDFIFMDLNPKNLFPTKVAFFSSGGYQITPLFYAMVSVMYGPEGRFFYLGPTLTYSLSDNIELAGIGQYYTMEAVDGPVGISIPNSGSAGFFRIKWSF